MLRRATQARSLHSSCRLCLLRSSSHGSSLKLTRRLYAQQSTNTRIASTVQSTLSSTAATLLGVALSSILVYSYISSSSPEGTHRDLLHTYYTYDSFSNDGENVKEEDGWQATTHLAASDGAGEGFQLSHSEANMEMDQATQFLDHGVIRTQVDELLYAAAGGFCPPEEDQTGIARVDSAGVSKSSPSSVYMTTSFAPTPTHTVVVWGMFQGTAARYTSSFLSDVLPLAIAAALGKLLLKYEKEERLQAGGGIDDDADELSTFTGGSSPTSSSMYGFGEESMPFTPDIVRPHPPSSVIDDTIKRAFTLVEDFIVWRRLEVILGRFAGSKFFPPPSTNANADSDNGKDVMDPSAYPRQLALQQLSDAQHGSSALVGVYESDTRTVKVALCGDGRALLGRQVSNTSYKPSARSSTEVSPEQTTKKRSHRDINDPLLGSLLSSVSDIVPLPKPLEPRKKQEYKNLYEATVIMSEHVPSNPGERKRIAKEHPDTYKKLFFAPQDEPSNGKGESETYMGIMTTRGFGYAPLKWPVHIQRWLRKYCLGEDVPSFFEDGRLPGPGLPTSSPLAPPTVSNNQRVEPAPYLTAEPEIVTITVVPGDFIVLGSRGIWESLSNDEVVGLVGAWVEERRRMLEESKGREHDHSLNPVRSSGRAVGNKGSMRDPETLLGSSGTFGGGTVTGLGQASGVLAGQGSSYQGERAPRLVDPSQLPVLTSLSSTASKAPWRWNQWNPAGMTPNSSLVAARTFTLDPKDLHSSASVHVLRNALGGADSDLREAILTSMVGKRGKWSDDMAVHVVFFE